MTKKSVSNKSKSVQQKFERLLFLNLHFDNDENLLADSQSHLLDELHELREYLSVKFRPLISGLAEVGCLSVMVQDPKYLKKKYKYVCYDVKIAYAGCGISLVLDTKSAEHSETVYKGHPNIGSNATLQDYARAYWKFILKGKKASFIDWYAENRVFAQAKFDEYRKTFSSRAA